MAVKKAEPDPKPRFNYLVCLDIVVLGGILVVAGRSDGLAITVSAIIVAIGVVVYRCTMGVKSYVSGKARTRTANPADSGRADHQKLPPAAQEHTPHHRASNKSWLREAE